MAVALVMAVLVAAALVAVPGIQVVAVPGTQVAAEQVAALAVVVALHVEPPPRAAPA